MKNNMFKKKFWSEIYRRRYKNSVTITSKTSLAIIKGLRQWRIQREKRLRHAVPHGTKIPLIAYSFPEITKNIHYRLEVQHPPLIKAVNLPRAAGKEEVVPFWFVFNFRIRNTINSYYGSFIRNAQKIILRNFFQEIYDGSCFRP